jgi:hypothetical protein
MTLEPNENHHSYWSRLAITLSSESSSTSSIDSNRGWITRAPSVQQLLVRQ